MKPFIQCYNDSVYRPVLFRKRNIKSEKEEKKEKEIRKLVDSYKGICCFSVSNKTLIVYLWEDINFNFSLSAFVTLYCLS